MAKRPALCSHPTLTGINNAGFFFAMSTTWAYFAVMRGSAWPRNSCTARSYPAPIVAIPGNHDGVVYAADPAPTLAAFLANFCAPSFAPSPDAGGLARATMIQPGVYFTGTT